MANETAETEVIEIGGARLLPVEWIVLDPNDPAPIRIHRFCWRDGKGVPCHKYVATSHDGGFGLLKSDPTPMYRHVSDLPRYPMPVASNLIEGCGFDSIEQIVDLLNRKRTAQPVE